MRGTLFFFTACLAAVCIPLVAVQFLASEPPDSAVEWPDHFEGRALTPVDLTAEERVFEATFPGKLANFSDGTRLIAIRWIQRASRAVHPASDCYRGLGYAVADHRMVTVTDEHPWSSFTATQDGRDTLLVRERITDAAGQSYPDVSTWYWAAFRGKTHAPWQAITVVEAAN